MSYNYKTNHSLIKNNLIKRIMLAALTIIFVSVLAVPAFADCSDSELYRIGDIKEDQWGGTIGLLEFESTYDSVAVNIQTPWGDNHYWETIDEGETKTYTDGDEIYQVHLVQIFEGMETTSAEIYSCYNQTPDTPTLTGETSGEPLTTYSYTATASDPDGDQVQYTFDWGEGHQTVTGFVASGTAVTRSWSWSAGTYTVKVKATDSEGVSSDWRSIPVTIQEGNLPPNVPTVDCPTWAKVGEWVFFTVTSTDPDGDDIEYEVEFGNGMLMIMRDKVPSGTSITTQMRYLEPGEYIVRAKAQDTSYAWSGWSSTKLIVSYTDPEIDPEPVAYPVLEDTQSIMLNDSPVEGFQSAQYMGSITQSIPIFTPPGTGGLQPNIALTYNSQSVDQIGIHQQAGVAGLGWSISGISYIFIKDGKDPASTSDDVYGLSFGGTSYELEEDKDVNDKYHTKPESYLRILDKGAYWEVTDKSGTFYQFGRYRNSKYYDKDGDRYRWSIDMVKDTSENEMYFTYDRTTSGDCTQSGRIASINYTYRSGVPVGNLRQVIFSYGSDRTDVYEWNKSLDDYGVFYETRKLDKITVQVGTTVVKEYSLGYDYSSDYVRDNVKIENGDFEEDDASGGFFVWTEKEEGNCHVEWYGNSSDWKAQLNGNGNQSYGHAMVYQTQDIYNPYSMLSFDALIDGDSAFAGLIVSIDDDDDLFDAPFANYIFPETDGNWHTYYIPMNKFVGENRRIRFYVYDPGNDNTGGYAIIDNVKVGSGPYLTLTSLTEKGTGSATHPGTRFVYDQNVLKYVQKQKTDSTWYNTASYSASKRRAGGNYYTKLSSITVQNGFDATSPFYTSSTNSYTDDDSSVYDYVKKELIGYSETIVTDPDGNKTKRYTFQDGGRRGLLDRVEFYDNASPSKLYSKITYDYENYYENKVNDHSFEDGFGDWDHSPGSGSIYIDSMHYADGVNGVVLTMNRASSNNNPELYQTVDLSGYASGEKISLWFYMWISTNALNNYMDMQVKVNNSVKYTNRMEQGFGDAEIVEVDLTAYAGNSSVTIEFTMDGIATSGLASYHLDDVRIIPEDMSSFKPRLKTKKIWTYDGDADFKIARTDFVEYDDYGHVTKTTAYHGSATDSDYHVHSYAYADMVYDLGEYIFRPAHARTTDAAGNTLSESWNYYDGTYNIAGYTGSYLTGSTNGLTKGRLTKTETRVTGSRGNSGNPKGYIRYDVYGNATKAWEANNHWVETSYDTTYHTFPNVVTNELFQSTQAQTYDAGTGNLLTARDANGQTTTNVYDSFGRLIKTYGPLTSSSKPLAVTMYRGDGVSDIDESGSAISDSISFPRYTIAAAREDAYEATATYLKSYAYADGLGRTIQTKSLSETSWIETNTIYNNRGMTDYTTTPKHMSNPTFTTSPNLTEKTSSVYDCLGRVTKVTTPDAKFVQTIYDDWTVKTIDQFNNTNRFTKTYHDAFGRVIRVDQKNNYDPNGNGTLGNYTYSSLVSYFMHAQVPGDSTYYPSVTKSTDAKGNIFWAAADILGRSVKTIDPDKGTWNYYYDSRIGYTTSYGNLIGQRDAKGNETKLEYDVLNRVTKKTFPGSGNYINYYYDNSPNARGRLTGAGKYENSTQKCYNSYMYDERGRFFNEGVTIEGLSAKYTYYTYDSMDRIDTITYPGGEIVKQTYGSDGSLDMLGTTTDTDKYVDEIWYDAFGRMTQMLYSNGVVDGWDYYSSSGNYRLYHEVTIRPTTMDIYKYNTYSYDYVGNITDISSPMNSNYDQSFTYDHLNRLTAQTNTGYAGGATNYSYDSINKIMNKTGVDKYTYSEVNAGPHAVTSAAGLTYSYDANGNMESVAPLLAEDFTNGLPSDWSVTNDGTGNEWVNYGSYDIITGQNQTGMRISFSGISTTEDSRLITKSIDCSGIVGTTLKFYEEWRGGYGDYWSDGYVYVSTDGGQNWAEVAHPHHCDINAPDETVSGIETIDISSYADGEPDVKIAFRYHGNYDWYWYIDNVQIAATPSNLITALYEDFSGALPSDWSVTNDNNGNIWTYDSAYGRMKIKYSGTSTTEDSRLITKSIDCSGIVGTTLKFYEEWRGGYGSYWSDGYVYVSTDGGQNWAEAAHPHNCPPEAPDESASGIKTIDISSYADGEPDVKIAFRYHGNYDWYWYIGNVQVTSGTSGGGRVFTAEYIYDSANNLVEVSGDVNAQYSYDHAGNRVKKIENDVTTYYINKYYEVEGIAPIKYYYANGKRIAKDHDGTLTFYHADHLGGSSRITDSDGNQIYELGYMPYGSDAYSTGGDGDEPVYKFTGKEQDSTGLYYYGARYYDPVLGRFISPDAYGDNYVYCNNNPLMYVDPDGNNPIPFLVAGARVLLGGARLGVRVVTTTARLAKKYAVPLGYVASNVVNAYIYGCEKGYVNEDTQSQVNEAVNSVGQSKSVQYAVNEMGIRFGYESVDARFYGMGVGDQFSKWGELQGTLFDGNSTRIFLDDSGNPVESDWVARPSAMYWNKGNLLVWADMGNDTDIYFYEKEGMPGKGEYKVPINIGPLKGIFKFDVGHMHYQVTNTENNTIYTIRPTAGMVAKINTIDSQAGIPKHLTVTPFSRRGVFLYVDSNKYNSWKSDIERGFWEKLGF